MVVFQTVNADGLVIRTAWDDFHAGPVELLITIDHADHPDGKGITERLIRRLSLQSMAPESMKTDGSLRVVGDWLEKRKPGLRTRPEDPQEFFAHVALFFVLTIQGGEKGVTRVLANYSGVNPSMAREWIAKARRLGMLTTPRAGCYTGRAVGHLTDKARTILASKSLNMPLADAA